MSKEDLKETKQVDNQEYGAEQITVLEGLEAVRKRPAMYIGTTDTKGFHHMWTEIYDNAVDEYMAGFGNEIITRLNKDGSITVRDFGRGMPPEKHKTGKPTPEVILSVLHAGGKFGQGGYKKSGGLHGVGSSVVNALSTYLEATIYRYGNKYHMRFEDGGSKVAQSLEIVEKGLDKEITGTEITFLPDDSIFSINVFNKEFIREKLRESAYLNKGLKLILVDDREVNEDTEIFQDGLSKKVITNYNKFIKEEKRIEKLMLDTDDSDEEDDDIIDSGEQTEDNLENTTEVITEEDVEEVSEFENQYTTNVEIYQFNGGLVDFVKDIGSGNTSLTKVINYEGTGDEDIDIDIAFQWSNGYHEKLYSYVNNVKTRDGGTHETGYKSAITKAVNDFAKDNSKNFANFNKKAKKKDKITSLDGDDIREGLTGVISVKVPEELLQFEGQTKGKLGTPVARRSVESFLYSNFLRYLTENPIIAEKLVGKSLESYMVKQKTTEVKRKQKTSNMGGNPDKHKKPTGKNYKKNELFLVEGSSAGGSAKQGRNKKTQGVLELRGKVLNTEQKTEHEMLENKELLTIIDAIGTGYGKDFDITKAKYGKVIIMTDADPDGQHILMLLLTFFYRYMRPLIDNGMLHVAQPPLYGYHTMNGKGKITQIEYTWGKKGEEEKALAKFPKNVKPTKQRYKGLGEMNDDQLYETTMNPEKRITIEVTNEDDTESDKSITKFMAKDTVESRKKYINKYMDLEMVENI